MYEKHIIKNQRDNLTLNGFLHDFCGYKTSITVILEIIKIQFKSNLLYSNTESKNKYCHRYNHTVNIPMIYVDWTLN